jgi:UDP-N-acetylglucosamine 4-epimerase
VTCNIASGTETSLLELLHAVCAAAGRKVRPVFGPPRPGDIRHSHADISLARGAIGYLPQASLEETLARTVEWFRGQIA